jgi:23S rRNA (adenine-N6)-dimethyltransferase
MPSVDGGILSITRRGAPLVPAEQRRAYERFVGDIFTARGRGMAAILAPVLRLSAPAARQILSATGIHPASLPRDLDAAQWARLWSSR